MYWVIPDRGVPPRPSTLTANAKLYEAVMVVVSQKLGGMFTVPVHSIDHYHFIEYEFNAGRISVAIGRLVFH